MKNRSKAEKLVPYAFIAPFMLSFFIFFFIPAAYSLVLSFFQYKGYGNMKFVGFDNYYNLLTYNTFWSSVRNTMFYFIMHTIPTMILAFLFAYILQSKLMARVQKVYKPLLFLPQVVPIIASSLIWRILLAKQFGPINQILGTSIDFLGGSDIKRWSVVALLIWRATGWYMVIYLAGLTTVGDEIIEAAKIDGASVLQRITRIILPIMQPIFLFAFVMNAISSIKLFSEPNVLLATDTGTIKDPGAMTIINVLLMNLRGANFGMASAVGWLVFILVLLITVTWFRVLGKREEA